MTLPPDFRNQLIEKGAEAMFALWGWPEDEGREAAAAVIDALQIEWAGLEWVPLPDDADQGATVNVFRLDVLSAHPTEQED